MIRNVKWLEMMSSLKMTIDLKLQPVWQMFGNEKWFVMTYGLK